MKRLSLLLFMAFLFTSMYANAEWRPMWHSMEEPVKVKVRHISFFIFPNGEFDFNAHGRRYRAAGYIGVRIERDRYGKIRRVGNVYINYNRYGQVSRIGNVFIKYNRHGLVERIGRKRIRYNRRGHYRIFGFDERPGFVYHAGISYGPSSGYYDTCASSVYTSSAGIDFYDGDYDNDTYEDDDNYYYRQPSKKKLKTKKRIKNRRR